MNDEKRQLRVMKRELKRAGNRQRRRFLKDVDVDVQNFDFGRRQTKPLNEKPKRKAKRWDRPNGPALDA